jgi:hypothetical protein
LDAVVWAGWLSYVAAFVTPIAALPGYASWPHYGVTWLLVGPVAGGRLVLAAGTRTLGVAVLVAVAANLAIFLRLPRSAALAFLVAPWIAYLIGIVSGIVSVHTINSYLPCFYPWALGITLILGAQALRAGSATPT